jgi:hypothetical protein
MNKTIALPIMIACAVVGCGSEDSGGADIPEFGGFPANGVGPNPTVPGATPTPGAPSPTGGATPLGTEGQGGTPPLAAPGTPGGAAAPGAAAPPPQATAGTASMLDVTIEAETLNQAASVGFASPPGALDVGGM